MTINPRNQLISIFKKAYFKNKIKFILDQVEQQEWNERLLSAGVSGANDVFTYTTRYELRALYKLAEGCPKNAVVLEIGSYLGASSCYIAAGLNKVDGHLFCVDTWNNETMTDGIRDTFLEFENNTRGVRNRITVIKKRSEDLQFADIKKTIDFVFIDADHSYESVKKDFDIAKKWLSEDGVIAFHDFSWHYFEGVTRVVGEALASGQWLVSGQVETLVWLKPAKWLQPSWLE